jgi:CheY-like chemotaxis protein
MDGYQVAEKLKSDAQTKVIPIIFISAMTQTDDKIRAFKAGGVDYVTKPLQVEEVMARVETHLSISRMRDQLNQANQKLLAWNVELSQRGGSTRSSSGFGIPERLAELFGKPASEVRDGDRADAQLSILAATSPSDETLAEIENGFDKNHDGCVIARFGGMLVGVSPSEIEPIAQWLEESFESNDLTASLSSGDGVLQVVPLKTGDSGLRLDFRSPAVLETVTSLTNQQD